MHSQLDAIVDEDKPSVLRVWIQSHGDSEYEWINVSGDSGMGVVLGRWFAVESEEEESYSSPKVSCENDLFAKVMSTSPVPLTRNPSFAVEECLGCSKADVGLPAATTTRTEKQVKSVLHDKREKSDA